jgi:hypothetical protein
MLVRKKFLRPFLFVRKKFLTPEKKFSSPPARQHFLEEKKNSSKGLFKKKK